MNFSWKNHNTLHKMVPKVTRILSAFFLKNHPIDFFSTLQKIFSICLYLLFDHCDVFAQIYTTLCYNVCTKYLHRAYSEHTTTKKKHPPKEQFGLQKTIVVGGICVTTTHHDSHFTHQELVSERCTN